MPQQSTDSELKDWQKRFAAMANNRAWELSVLERTAEQDQEMLDAAHASAWHWGAVETHRVAYQAAKIALHAIADDEDRAIVNKTFSHVPWPG